MAELDALPRKSCSIEGCDRVAEKRGWCVPHYGRWRRHGDPVAGRTPLGTATRYLEEVALTFSGDECLPWPYERNKYGYGIVNNKKASRLVCEAAHGAPPTSKHQAAHSCGNGHLACVNPRHLRWATQAENMADMIAHGRSTRGSRHPRAKLQDDQVRQIRSRKAAGVRTTEIASAFGVSRSLVDAIVARTLWGHLDDQ